MEHSVVQAIGTQGVAILIVGVILVLISILFMILGWFMVRTLKQVDSNQTELWREMKDVRNGLTVLQTEHHLLVGDRPPLHQNINMHCQPERG